MEHMMMDSMKKMIFENANKVEIDQFFDDQAAFLLQKQKLERIENFNGYFEFLNTEYFCDIFFDGLIFKSVAFALQAARCSPRHLREKISHSDTLLEVYDIASRVDDPPDWISNRVIIMEKLLRDKYRRHRDLRERLKATADRELINSYSDSSASNTFWGIVNGKGQNQVGRILMQIRHDIETDVELEKWILCTFTLLNDQLMRPKLGMDVYKDSKKVDAYDLKSKAVFQFGQLKKNDFVLMHQSISRNHACIIIDEIFGVCLIDLASKTGTFINGKKLEISHYPYIIQNHDNITFAVSSRSYEVFLDFSRVEDIIRVKKAQLEREMAILDKLSGDNVKQEDILASFGVTADDTIFVSGLSEDFSIPELKAFFVNFGEIVDLRVPLDKESGRTRKIAFITFKTEAAAQKALSADHSELFGKRLRVSIAQKRTEFGSKARSALEGQNEKGNEDSPEKKNAENPKYKSNRKRRSRSSSSSQERRNHKKGQDNRNHKKPKHRREYLSENENDEKQSKKKRK